MVCSYRKCQLFHWSMFEEGVNRECKAVTLQLEVASRLVSLDQTARQD